MRSMNRWVIATAGIFLQIALGAVYAWSVFRIPLARQFGWSIPEVTFTFTISIFVLGVAGPTHCCTDRWGSLWSGSLPGQFLRPRAVVVVSELRSNRRNWFGLQLHRADCSACQMVSRSQGINYRDSGRRFWCRGFNHRACGHSTDSDCRRASHIRVSWHRVLSRHGYFRFVHAESSGRLEA